MRFIIQEKVKEKKMKPQFIFEVKTWRGDEDPEIYEIGSFYKDLPNLKKAMEDLVTVLEDMKNQFPRSKRIMDSYSGDGFKRWFVGIADEVYDSMDPRTQELYESHSWPCDKYGNHNYLLDYKVVYYDEFGVKFEVSVEL